MYSWPFQIEMVCGNIKIMSFLDLALKAMATGKMLITNNPVGICLIGGYNSNIAYLVIYSGSTFTLYDIFAGAVIANATYEQAKAYVERLCMLPRATRVCHYESGFTVDDVRVGG